MTTTRYLWNPINQNIIREYDGAGNTVASYTTEPDLYGDVVSQHRDGQDSYYHTDGQGSTLALTDSNGDVTDTYAYSSFGEVSAQIGSTVNPYHYIGQKGYYFDEETGEYEVRKRPLLANTGRWISEDPYPFTLDRNVYEYVLNSPLRFVDPSGNVEVTFDYDTFIPWQWVSIPPIPAASAGVIKSWVRGDNRNVSPTPLRGNETKVWNYVTINSCGCHNGLSLIGNCDGDNSFSVRRDLTVFGAYIYTTGLGTVTMTESARSQCNDNGNRCTINGSLRGSGRVPFHVASLPAAIDFTLNFQIDHKPDGWLTVIVSGNHDGFPAHEAYVTIDGQSKLAYSYVPPGNHWTGSAFRLLGLYQRQQVGTILAWAGWFDPCPSCCQSHDRFSFCQQWRDWSGLKHDRGE